MLQDTRRGSPFRRPQTAFDVLHFCVEDAVVNPLMDTLYVFYYPICSSEDQLIFKVTSELNSDSESSTQSFFKVKDIIWHGMIVAAQACLGETYKQHTISSKLKYLSDALQILLMHKDGSKEELVVLAFL